MFRVIMGPWTMYIQAPPLHHPNRRLLRVARGRRHQDSPGMKDGSPFALAGLWDVWKGPQGDVTSCTIIVTDANQFMRRLHDRMPVILDPNDYERWLDPAIQDTTSIKRLLAPAPNDWLTEWTVCRQLNNPRHEDPECAEPVQRILEY
ncbi:MAG: SOS response-associated peptidase family protein [Thiobacillus sp.]